LRREILRLGKNGAEVRFRFSTWFLGQSSK